MPISTRGASTMPGVDHETVIAMPGSLPGVRCRPAGIPAARAARAQNSGPAAAAAPAPAMPLRNWRRVLRARR